MLPQHDIKKRSTSKNFSIGFDTFRGEWTAPYLMICLAARRSDDSHQCQTWQTLYCPIQELSG